jgi:hypothetical protein
MTGCVASPVPRPPDPRVVEREFPSHCPICKHEHVFQSAQAAQLARLRWGREIGELVTKAVHEIISRFESRGHY